MVLLFQSGIVRFLRKLLWSDVPALWGPASRDDERLSGSRATDGCAAWAGDRNRSPIPQGFAAKPCGATKQSTKYDGWKYRMKAMSVRTILQIVPVLSLSAILHAQSDMVDRYLTALAMQQLQAREAKIGAIHTAAD